MKLSHQKGVKLKGFQDKREYDLEKRNNKENFDRKKLLSSQVLRYVHDSKQS
jgi:hypothetical protein